MTIGGRVALVTGGGKGIGAAVARALAGTGVTVAIAGRDASALEKTASSISGGGTGASRVLVTAGDITDPASAERTLERVRSELGAVDILVNNAGLAEGAPLKATDDALWDAHLALNLTAPFRLSRALAPGMVERGWGRIINIASVAGRTGYPYTSAYSASKAGLLGLTRALAMELAGRGVTVNAICPGWVETEMTDRALARITQKTGRTPEQARAELTARGPQHRFMTAPEVAALALYLASDEARGVNGQSWNIDGGEVMS